MTDEERAELIRIQQVWDSYTWTFTPPGRDPNYYRAIRARLRLTFGDYVRHCLPHYRPTQIADRIKDRERWAREKAH